MSAIVLGASLFAMPALTDAANGAAARDAHLVMPIPYLALAPICDALDTISLFSQRQHFAFLATCALCFVAWRVMRRRRAIARHRRVGKESLMAALALLALITLYAAGTLLPRPVAKLAVTSPNAIIIDFHSHTSFSWDGRADFTPEANRRWHQASGVDAAYVTDHGTFGGAVEAARHNPARAGDGTVLLSGIEVRSMGRHLDILGTDARDSGAYTADDLDENDFVQKVRTRTAVPPIVLLTLPGNINPPTAAVPIDAIEISDGAPRALAQIDAQRQTILDLVRRDGIGMVAGSNNHGWARAVPAWSVMEIAGWRSMSPSQLDSAIRQTMFQRGYRAVRVVERRAPGPTSSTALALTVPLAAWRMLATMSWAERLAWLSWIWIGYILARLVSTWTLAEKRASISGESPLYDPLRI
jgi:hypothetical protein